MASWDAEIGFHTQHAIGVRSKACLPRDDIFQDLYQSIKHPQSASLIISVEAPTGYGKTVMMARLAQRLMEKYPRQTSLSPQSPSSLQPRQLSTTLSSIPQGNNEMRNREETNTHSNDQSFSQKHLPDLEDPSSSLNISPSVEIVENAACCIFPRFFPRTSTPRKLSNASNKCKPTTASSSSSSSSSTMAVFENQRNISDMIANTPHNNNAANDTTSNIYTPKNISNSGNWLPIGNNNLQSPVSRFSSFLIPPTMTPVVIYRFCGISRHSSTLAGLLLSILYHIHLHFKLSFPSYLELSSHNLWSIPYAPVADVEFLSAQIQYFLCQYPVLLLIDGLDRLSFPESSFHSSLECFGKWILRNYDNNTDEINIWHKQSRCILSHNISHFPQTMKFSNDYSSSMYHNMRKNGVYMTAYGLPSDHSALCIVDIPVLSQPEGELLLRSIMSLPTASNTNMQNTVSHRLKCFFDDTNNARIEAKTERLWRYVQRRVKLHCVPLYIVLVATLMNYRLWSESDDVDDDEEEEEDGKQLLQYTGSQYLYWRWTGFQEWLTHTYSSPYKTNHVNNASISNMEDKFALSGTSNMWSNMTTASMFALLHHPVSAVSLTQNNLSLYIAKDITSVATQILAYLETKLEITIMQNALTLLMLTPTGVSATEMVDLLCLQYDIQSLFFPGTTENSNNDRDMVVQEGRYQVQEMWLSVLSCLSGGIPWLMTQYDSQRYICQHEILRVTMQRRYVNYQDTSQYYGAPPQDTHVTTLQLLLTRYFANVLPPAERNAFHISPQPLLLASELENGDREAHHDALSGRKDDYFLSQRQARHQEKLHLWSLCRNTSGLNLNDRRLVESMRHVSQCVALLSSDDLAAIVGDVCHVSYIYLYYSLLGCPLLYQDSDIDLLWRHKKYSKSVSHLEVFYRECLLRLYKAVTNTQTSSLESTLLTQTVQFVSHILSQRPTEHIDNKRSNDLNTLYSTWSLDIKHFLFTLTKQITQNQSGIHNNTNNSNNNISYDLLLAQWQELLSHSPYLSNYMQKDNIIDYLVSYNKNGITKEVNSKLTGICFCSGSCHYNYYDKKTNDNVRVLNNTSGPVVLSVDAIVGDMFYYHAKLKRLVRHSILSGLRRQTFDFFPLIDIDSNINNSSDNNANTISNTSLFLDKKNNNVCLREIHHCLVSLDGLVVVTLATVMCSDILSQGEICIWESDTGQCRFQIVCDVSLISATSVATLSNSYIFVYGYNQNNNNNSNNYVMAWDVVTGLNLIITLASSINNTQVARNNANNNSNMEDQSKNVSNIDMIDTASAKSSDINVFATVLSMVSVNTYEGDKLLLVQGNERRSPPDDPTDNFRCLGSSIRSVPRSNWIHTSIAIYQTNTNTTNTFSKRTNNTNHNRKWTCVFVATLSDLFYSHHNLFAAPAASHFCDVYYDNHSQTFQLVTSQAMQNVGNAVYIWDLDMLYHYRVQNNNKAETSLPNSTYYDDDDGDEDTVSSKSITRSTIDSSFGNKASLYERVKHRVSFFSRTSSSSAASQSRNNNVLNNDLKISNSKCTNSHRIIGLVGAWSVSEFLSKDETALDFFLINIDNASDNNNNVSIGVLVSHNHNNHINNDDKLALTVKVYDILVSSGRGIVSPGRDLFVRSSLLFAIKNKPTIDEAIHLTDIVTNDTKNKYTYATDTIYLSHKEIASLTSITCRLSKDKNQRQQVLFVSRLNLETHIEEHSLRHANHTNTEMASSAIETESNDQGMNFFSRLQLQSEQQLPLLVFSHHDPHDTLSASSSEAQYLATRQAVYNTTTQTVLFLFQDIFENETAKEPCQNSDNYNASNMNNQLQYYYVVQSLCFSSDNRLLFAVVLKENCSTCVTTGELWTIDVSSACVLRKQMCHEQDTLYFWPRRQRRVVWVRHSSATQDDPIDTSLYPPCDTPIVSTNNNSTTAVPRHSETHSQDGRVDLYDAETQQLLLRCPKHHRQVIFQVVFHPLGDLAVSVDYDGTLKLWRTVTGEVLHTVTQAVHSFQWLLFWDRCSPDTAEVGTREVKRLLLTPYDTSRDAHRHTYNNTNNIHNTNNSDEGSRHGFFVWDTDTGRQQGIILLPAQHNHIHCFQLYKDVFVYQVWKNDHTLYMFDLKTQRIVTTLELSMSLSSFAIQDATGKMVVKLKPKYKHTNKNRYNNNNYSEEEHLMEIILVPA